MSTPPEKGPTEHEIKLGEIGKEMGDVAKELTGGREYMEKQAKLDKSERYEEQQLGRVQAADAASVGANEQAPIVSYDQRDRSNIGTASLAQTESEQAQAAVNLAASDVGQSAVATTAETKLGYDEMALQQQEYKSNMQKQGLPFELLGVAAGATSAYAAGGGFKPKKKGG